MISLLSHAGNVIELRIGGDVKKENYEWILNLMDEKINQYGKMHLYLEIVDIESVDPEAVWKDLKFDVKHINDFGKVAVVSPDKNWTGLIKLGQYFSSATVKTYGMDEAESAKAWVEEELASL